MNGLAIMIRIVNFISFIWIVNCKEISKFRVCEWVETFQFCMASKEMPQKEKRQNTFIFWKKALVKDAEKCRNISNILKGTLTGLFENIFCKV